MAVTSCRHHRTVECHPGGLQTTVGGGPQQRTTAARIGQTSAGVDAYAPTGSKDGGGTVGNVETVVVLVVGCQWAPGSEDVNLVN